VELINPIVNIFPPKPGSCIYHPFRWTVFMGGCTWTAENKTAAVQSVINALSLQIDRLRKEIS
jgi:hypothetical protein